MAENAPIIIIVAPECDFATLVLKAALNAIMLP
jgi:hypothetical protein